MKTKLIIAGLVVIVTIYALGHYIINRSSIKNGVYTEKVLPVPVDLAKGKIVVARDSYLATGFDKDYANLETFGKIEKQIIGIEAIKNSTIGESYFISRGLVVEPLKKGMSFSVDSVIEITKHGFQAIDSGPGPYYYLILRDKDGVLYEIAIDSLGLNDEYLFLSFMDSSQENEPSVKFLNPFSFDRPTNGKPFGYNGNLVEIMKEE